jgi:hypothetical protein
MDHQTEPPAVDDRILRIRGQRVMLDFDLAPMYHVTTKKLNQQVRRNRERFPDDFMFQLTWDEARALSVARPPEDDSGRGHHLKYLPFAFTEHGAVMLASVLKSPTAVAASIQIVRAFNRMRRLLVAHKELAAKLAELEGKVDTHDGQIQALFAAMRSFLAPPPEPPRKIGFKPEEPGRPRLAPRLPQLAPRLPQLAPRLPRLAPRLPQLAPGVAPSCPI